MRTIAKTISILFHPLFILSYLFFLLLLINPYLFSIQDAQNKVLVLISIVSLSVGFPLVVVALFKMIGFIDSFEMKDRTERIGPMIATSIFYLWLFLNVKDNPIFPKAYSVMVLGATIGLFCAFFINNFSKISLHGVGMGGLVSAVFLIRFQYSYQYLIFENTTFGNYQIHLNLVLYASLLIAGLVCSCRLLLKAHNRNDLYGGFIVGVIAQIIAYRVLI